MESFEIRHKICRATGIAMVVVAFICCFVVVIIVKSTDILANSMEGVQSTEIGSMAIQWVFQQSQGFKACTIVFCVIEFIGFGIILYCKIEGIHPPKAKQIIQEKTEINAETQNVCSERCNSSDIVTPIVGKEISNDGQMSDKESQDERDTSIEAQIMNYLSGYKHKSIWAYAYNWLTDNGSLYGTSQEDFIKYVKDYTNIDVSKSHMSTRNAKIKNVLNNPKSDDTVYKEYGRVSDFLASKLKKNQPFEINQQENKGKY